MFVSKRSARASLVSLGIFLAICLAGNLTGFAAAAQLSPSQLGAGASSVASCQAAPIVAAFDTGYDPSLGGYAVTAVRFSGLDTVGPMNCGDKAFLVALSDAMGAAIAEAGGSTPASGSTFSVDLSGSHVPVASVAAVHVTFST